MSSPLSQNTRASVDFLISTSCAVRRKKKHTLWFPSYVIFNRNCTSKNCVLSNVVLGVFVQSGTQNTLASSDKVAPKIHPCMCHQGLIDHNSFKIYKNEWGWHFILMDNPHLYQMLHCWDVIEIIIQMSFWTIFQTIQHQILNPR